ncbi:MAG: hypothetical protein E7311_07185 [Clostridiales bacterium]|nr:hypothetical protein [Clostridiales bacterium]
MKYKYKYKNLKSHQISNFFPGRLPCCCFAKKNNNSYNIKLFYGVIVAGFHIPTIKEITVKCNYCKREMKFDVSHLSIHINKIHFF